MSDLSLDRERVTCLLLINSQLMKKAINIYTNILTNPQMLLQTLPPNKQTVMELYQNCTRRIHCNLSVLTFINERYHADGLQPPLQGRPQFPIIMSAPPDMPELAQLYTKLQELYPEALQFLKMKILQMRKSQAQGQAPAQAQARAQAQSARIGGLAGGMSPHAAMSPAYGAAQMSPAAQMSAVAPPGAPGAPGAFASPQFGEQYPPRAQFAAPMMNSPAAAAGFDVYDPAMILRQQQRPAAPAQQPPQQFVQPSLSPQQIMQMGQSPSGAMMDFFNV